MGLKSDGFPAVCKIHGDGGALPEFAVAWEVVVL